MEELLRELGKMPHVASVQDEGLHREAPDFRNLTIEITTPHLLSKVRRLANVRGFATELIKEKRATVQLLRLTRKIGQNASILFVHTSSSEPATSFKLTDPTVLENRTRDQIIRFFRGLHGEQRPTGRLRG